MAGLSSEVPTDPRIPLPHIVSDPIASIVCSPIDVTLLGRAWTIPALPAAAWLQLLMAPDPDFWDIIPGLLPPEVDDALTEAMLDDKITFQEIFDLCTQTIEVAAGRPWWLTIKLVIIAKKSWEVVGGELAYRRIDPQVIPFGAWLDAVLLICVKGLSADKVTMFLSQLEMPPKGIEAPEIEMEMSEFMAMGG